MVRIQNISKSYGARTLFSEVTFNINQKEKIGLVGRNGHGKSTLFRILTGEEHTDSGEIEFPNGYRAGFLQQNLKFGGGTVLDEAAAGLRDFERDEIWKAERILMGLGFQREDMTRMPAEFSGGYQIRIHLAKILLSNLTAAADEPTNYLDITHPLA
jgi:ATP-binding cassette subfamily F protein 3